jgi:hypothetical protein
LVKYSHSGANFRKGRKEIIKKKGKPLKQGLPGGFISLNVG